MGMQIILKNNIEREEIQHKFDKISISRAIFITVNIRRLKFYVIEIKILEPANKNCNTCMVDEKQDIFNFRMHK